MKRTDLAMEAHAMWEKAAEGEQIPGVQMRTREQGALKISTLEIRSDEGARSLGKPQGTYLSMELSSRHGAVRKQAAQQLAKALRQMLGSVRGSVLVVGLGNRSVTPDALGVRTVEQLLVTNHLSFPYLRPVMALCPGVQGQTGMESLAIVRGVVERTRPAKVIAVDALAAAEVNRIGTVVQLSDAGIHPGSGVGNRQAGFHKESLGVPVLALGVPTVTDLGEAASGLIVTGADIDAAIEGMSKMLSQALNRALQPELSPEEIEEFVM